MFKKLFGIDRATPSFCGMVRKTDRWGGRVRKHNFNAGPAALPLEVLQKAAEQLVDHQGIGMSIMEVSHRSADYEAVHAQAQQLLRELLNIPDNYKVLFLQGGASLQFAMVPMNFLAPGKVACYVETGNWANKAIKEAKLIGEIAGCVVAAVRARGTRAPGRPWTPWRSRSCRGRRMRRARCPC